MTTITLPPLPKPENRLLFHSPLFTADQLRARDHAVAQAVIEACAREIDCGCPNRAAARAARGTAQRWAACGQPNCAAREADNIRAMKIEANDANV